MYRRRTTVCNYFRGVSLFVLKSPFNATVMRELSSTNTVGEEMEEEEERTLETKSGGKCRRQSFAI